MRSCKQLLVLQNQSFRLSKNARKVSPHPVWYVQRHCFTLHVTSIHHFCTNTAKLLNFEISALVWMLCLSFQKGKDFLFRAKGLRREFVFAGNFELPLAVAGVRLF
jgi:hypothetical protein